ncbi:L,D-transpeptidase family protein [Acinetobacter haemolyticus]|uniref:L,D-transpeptidase family protein n=1 Tax=Acinetobacter haemolyticus TaxID=29430 RepID=UPI001298757B|nr:L,D-transpeptidase family protein [Acinetobacter haemolyticus]MCU4377890.1 L,D-transpeptidase family protein [Acinetobacter haemolyticus]MQZ31620.1 L,D-transpeptidase family protein [Acinetobacter haemolyticus]
MKPWIAICASIIILLIGIGLYVYRAYIPNTMMPTGSVMPQSLSDEEIIYIRDNTPITKIEVFKHQRILQLKHHNEIIREYPMRLGFNPLGHKQFEGDGKTPEGTYSIDWRNPNSAYYKSLHISYPNEQDAAYAKQQGRSAGGDIMIHGSVPKEYLNLPTSMTYFPQGDWTLGCIAVRNIDMDEIWQLVDNNTQIVIHP